jgi:hypothetical protein
LQLVVVVVVVVVVVEVVAVVVVVVVVSVVVNKITLRFFRAFSSVVRQMPRYNSQKRRGTARTSQISYFLLLCMFNLSIVMYVPFS